MNRIFLVRHGQTDWTETGQHTSMTDLSLNQQGISDARSLGKGLEGHRFSTVWTSPLSRARTTCELAGLLPHAKIDPELVEWNYGQYEGLTSQEINAVNPNWNLFIHGAPGGESVDAMKQRTSRVVDRLRTIEGDVIVFSHGHFLTALTMTWLEFNLSEGRHFTLNPSSLSILTYKGATPVLLLWNDISHSNKKIFNIYPV